MNTARCLDWYANGPTSDLRPTMSAEARPPAVAAGPFHEMRAMLTTIRANFDFVDAMVRPTATAGVADSLDAVRDDLERLEAAMENVEADVPTQRAPQVVPVSVRFR